jgi:PKD repeat protein
MKILKTIGLFFISALALSSCVDKDPDYTDFPDPDVDFTYNVDGDQFTLDYYVVSTIQFNNTSAKSGAVTWNFGDGTTSTEPNPKHKYASAGNYKVTLTVDGVGSRTYPLMIYDIVPQLSVASQSDDIIQFRQTSVDFSIFLPNPENKRVRYVWTFPDGTTDENGQALTTFEGVSEADGTIPYPGKVKFSNIGSQKITIASYFDIDGENRRLEDSYLNVQVGLTEPAATLYYAQRDGNIKALKLVDASQLPSGTKILPFDMGVKSGSMPFQIVYGEQAGTDDDGNATTEGWIYILDAGKQYYYCNDESGTMGDGQITAMRVDGTGVNTVITNVGQAAFCDPYQGFVYDGGISTVELTTRGAVQGITQSGSTYLRSSFFAKNELVPYYGRGLAYGAIHTGILRDSKGVWWWGKNYNGNGIFRFKDTDIYTTQTAAEGASLPYPIVMNGLAFKAFTIDETRGNLYVWRIKSNEGFVVYPLPGDNDGGDMSKPTKSFSMQADPINTTSDEMVCTTQFALDQTNGRVYFGFRPASTDTSGFKAGVCYYDPATNSIKSFGETNDLILGITINPNKTKLF